MAFFPCRSLELLWPFLVVRTVAHKPRIIDSLITKAHLCFSRHLLTDVSWACTYAPI